MKSSLKRQVVQDPLWAAKRIAELEGVIKETLKFFEQWEDYPGTPDQVEEMLKRALKP